MPPTKRRKTDQDETNASEENASNNKPSTSKIDWRPKSLKERYQHALKDGHLADVTFSVGSEKTIFHAHKMILSLATPVFEAMFYGSLREVSEQIEITDIVPIGFKLLLDYVYTDDLKFNNESDAFAAWIAADKYCLPYLEDLCFKYLFRCKINNTNVWTVLEHSLFLNSSPLINRCCSYLKTNISKAILSERFVDISSETLKSILIMPSLSIKEILLLKSIMLWAHERIKPESEETVTELLKPFMEYIRFDRMSQSEFVDFIDEYPDIISDSDTVKILKYMTDDKQYSLPEWCCSSGNSRKPFEKHRENVFSVLRSNISAYTLKPQNVNRRSADCSSDLQDHPDNELYRDYHNRDNRDISSDSDLSSGCSCSSQHSDNESIPGEDMDEDISSSSSSFSSSSE